MGDDDEAACVCGSCDAGPGPLPLCRRSDVLLSFDGCGWLYAIHFGVASALADVFDVSHESLRACGASAGALISASLLLGWALRAACVCWWWW